jgi:hypothetical protein
MKSKINLLVLISAFVMGAECVNAQVEMGIREGVAASTLSHIGNLADNNNIVVSNLSGLFVTIPVNGSFAVQPECNYLKKGRSNEEDIFGTSAKTDYMMNFLQLPLLFQYRNATISGSGNTTFYFNAGPYAAINLNNEQHRKNGDESLILVTGEKEKADWGLALGLGFQTPVWQRKLRVDLKYDLGLTSISGQPEDFNTKCLSLTLGIVI